jgi:hypothetical protein
MRRKKMYTGMPVDKNYDMVNPGDERIRPFGFGFGRPFGFGFGRPFGFGFGRPFGFGFGPWGFGLPFLGGLAAGALLAGPWGYGYPYGYGYGYGYPYGYDYGYGYPYWY